MVAAAAAAGKRETKKVERLEMPKPVIKKKVKKAKPAAAPKPKKEKASKKEKAAKPAGKKEKKKDGPKRGLSAFMFFSSDKREEIKAANPGCTFGEVGKHLGAAWAKLDEKEKKPYADKAAADKARYEKEKAKA